MPSADPCLAHLGQRTLVMGVLNVTPDSFSDGGRYLSCDTAVRRAREMSAEGADLIDIGGESTRPGSDPVSLQEELDRVLPVVDSLKRNGFHGLSIDTTKAEVARQATRAGATIVNDISGLSFDPDMAGVVADSGAHVVLSHTRGRPKTMQEGEIEYPEGVVRAVIGSLTRSIELALAAGIERSRLFVDPGFGFGKTLEHNCTLLRDLSELRVLGAPVVIGTSRKRFLGNLTNRAVDDREFATAATLALAVHAGASVVRVHNVRAAVDVVRVADAVVRTLLPRRRASSEP